MSNLIDARSSSAGPSAKGKEVAIASSSTSTSTPSYDDHKSIESTERLILHILQEDHNELLAGCNQSREFSQTPDAELSLTLWRTEIHVAEQTLKDRAMALSIGNAIAADQHVIAAVEQEECIDRQDRALALHLHRNPNASDDVDYTTLPAQNAVADSNLVFETIASLADQTTKASEDASEVPSSSKGKQKLQADVCSICFSTMDESSIFHPTCQHVWCQNCLRRSFLSATRDEQLYPPRCCGNICPPSIAMRILDFSELKAFCRAGLENSSTNRVYCADPTCSEFIPVWMINGERAECERCHKVTHTTCKALGEPNHDCPSDQDLPKTLGLAAEHGWKRCTKCRAVVEINSGCDHMTCRCGAEFCYNCGTAWKNCTCDLWHEQRLMHVAHRAVDRNNGQQHPEERAAALANIVQVLRDHVNEDCQHHLNTQWYRVYATDGRGLACEICDHVLPDYLYACYGCEMQVCHRCRMNRLR